MAKRSWSVTVKGMALLVGVCGGLLSGCNDVESQPPPDVDQPLNGHSTDFVPGNVDADGIGPENYDFVGGVELRFLANVASMTPGSYNDDYFLNYEAGVSYSAELQSNGDLIFEGRDFTSPVSGLRYQYMGYMFFGTYDLRTNNPVTITLDERTGTLRGYWCTVRQ